MEYLLEKRNRNFFPPTDTRTIWRRVFPDSPGSGGRLFGSTNWGAVAHVVSHRSLDDCFSRLCEEEQETKNPEMMKIYKLLKRIFYIFLSQRFKDH